MTVCLICERIEAIKRGQNPYFVKEYPTGYLVLGDHQYFKGYCLFLAKQHVTELHDLPKDERDRYLSEMADVSEVVARAFKASKMNIESLGNGDAHLHFHLFPRQEGDLGHYGHQGKGPVWWLPFEVMYGDASRPSQKELDRLKLQLETILFEDKV